PYKDNVEFIKKTSMEAVKQFEDYSLDFVYIDAAHDFNNIMLDLIKWVPKVKIGGAVCGHDYNTPC
ncbi:class I SAM-dependent methyltransferase, partial [Candidatus Saccharibacteria bacterium]|nr:class I SAM-dependent methyltransferase [Candidatus Saccharibacteria bacterium]NIW78424.1 class I SAM-dependent methyltransferase [Calditrichia bacterium]